MDLIAVQCFPCAWTPLWSPASGGGSLLPVTASDIFTIRLPDCHQEVTFAQEPMVLKVEVQAALKASVKNKAPAIDGLPVEMFQQTDAALDVLAHLCQEIWKTATWPTNWKRSIFMPIPKKGDPTECGKYRTISLISHASKILLKITQKRLQRYTDKELPEIQGGFRRGCGARDIVADVRWILAESREYQKDVYLCLIDYAKAFNCVHHNKL
ncbi:uncharacterized protein LOC126084983 [Elephas maximus indicus]|uniref:uncharacterized protein LOC126084983 n=1 Tax=Elephas maximus indicus TaxID=99487 RepID=UPI0021168C95|nr:uncharacterized protein LOC126084983 [Elephas maximus indicus]